MGKHLAPPPVSSDPDPFEPSRPSRQKGHLRVVPIAALGVLFFLCIAVGFLALRAKAHHRTLQQEIVNIFIPPPEQIFAKDRISLLVLGIDYNYTERDMHYSNGARSDTIFVTTLDFPTRGVSMLSIPRDMEATLPNGEVDKINAAYGEGGAREADQVIGGFLGIPRTSSGHYFDRYIVLRVDASKDLINAIGGVDVDVMNSNAITHSGPNGPLDYDDNWGHLHIHLKPGMQHLNGDQAVGYVRFRHDWCSDPCRILRQQQVMRTIVDKLKRDKFNDVAHVRDLLGVAKRDIETNLSFDEELSLATAFSQVEQAGIKTGQLAYTGDKEVAAGDVLIPDPAKDQKMIQDLIMGPLGAPPTIPPTVVSNIKPSDLAIDVLNGSGIPGMAKQFASLLRTKGYNVGKVGNAETFGHAQTQILEHSRIFGAGARVRSDVAIIPGLVVSADPAPAPSTGWKSDVTVIVGKDFADAIAARPAAR
ncbi:MAG TPA: LCP family protein [Candidatus Baltobacteraceae bacterium]